jgi:LPS export ABC transporter protein LptC
LAEISSAIVLARPRIKKLSIVLLIVILLAIGTVVTVFVGYRRVSNAPELLLSSIKDGANLSLGKIRQTATRDGRKEWSLEAGSAHYLENEKKAVLKDLFITYFLKNGEEVYLNADQGILNTDTNDIEFSGNVVIRNEQYRLNTQHMNYDHKRRFIYTDDPVKIAGEAAEVSANALTYDLNAKKIVLTGSVAAAVSRNFTPARGLNKR